MCFTTTLAENPALPGNHTIHIKHNPLSQEFLNQTKNIPVVLSSSPIKILGKSVKGFMSYDVSLKQETTY